MKRRNFINTVSLTSIGVIVGTSAKGSLIETPENDASKLRDPVEPRIISTWNHGMEANAMAMGTLNNGKNALDAVEAGVRVSESDPEVTSVGFGGLPDREGKVIGFFK